MCDQWLTQCASSMHTKAMGGSEGSREPNRPPPPVTASGDTSRK